MIFSSLRQGDPLRISPYRRTGFPPATPNRPGQTSRNRHTSARREFYTANRRFLMADRYDLPKIKPDKQPSYFNREAGGWGLLGGFAAAVAAVPFLTKDLLKNRPAY